MALVRFPDGELRAAYFFGGPEVVVPLLFPLEEAPAVWERGLEPLLAQLSEVDLEGPEPTDTEPVEIWADHGTTFWWEGHASRSAAFLLDGVDPRGTAADLDDPAAAQPRTVHDGVPDWVPGDWRPA